MRSATVKRLRSRGGGFKVERHNTVTGAAIVGGLAGMVAASVVTSGNDSTGPVDFVSLDEAAALTMLAELQLAE